MTSPYSFWTWLPARSGEQAFPPAVFSHLCWQSFALQVDGGLVVDNRGQKGQSSPGQRSRSGNGVDAAADRRHRRFLQVTGPGGEDADGAVARLLDDAAAREQAAQNMLFEAQRLHCQGVSLKMVVKDARQGDNLLALVEETAWRLHGARLSLAVEIPADPRWYDLAAIGVYADHLLLFGDEAPDVQLLAPVPPRTLLLVLSADGDGLPPAAAPDRVQLVLEQHLGGVALWQPDFDRWERWWTLLQPLTLKGWRR